MTEKYDMQEIFSKNKSRKKNIFFDVRSTKAGDYYMTITESVKGIYLMNRSYKNIKLSI